MNSGAVRAICFDLDNTLWEVGPVLLRADAILADWLCSRYPPIAAKFSPAQVLAHRAALASEQPHRAHDFTYLRRESLARLASAAGYDDESSRNIAREGFSTWHAARNRCEPFDDVVPALQRLRAQYRLSTLTNGNADLGCIGLAHHFEVSLHAGALGCAKPDPRAYLALADALTLKPAEILFVGDEPHADVAGPRSAGMQTVWVNRVGARWPDALPAPDASVTDLAGLVTLLTK